MEQLFWRSNGNRNLQIAFGTVNGARPMGDRKGRPYAWSVALVGVALRGHPGDGTESVPYIRKQSFALLLQIKIEFARKDKNKIIY